ncbi:hypothetical protein PENSPDRAFT_479304 [Peniophora sp. CONT]|nr:hypothetical protein PENSPDRAFT_479304 [Peniophora sp. CONT]
MRLPSQLLQRPYLIVPTSHACLLPLPVTSHTHTLPVAFSLPSSESRNALHLYTATPEYGHVLVRIEIYITLMLAL